MIEINNPAKVDDLMHKMLEEHLEEEHANLYIKAAALYDQLDKPLFDQCLLEVLEKRQFQVLLKDFREILKEIIKSGRTNSERLQEIINTIDKEKDIQHDDQVKKIVLELRAAMQVQTFALTPLFAEAAQYIKKMQRSSTFNNILILVLCRWQAAVAHIYNAPTSG
ncbi:MAG: hypothetical protein ACRCXC_05625 [Legionella sp.]